MYSAASRNVRHELIWLRYWLGTKEYLKGTEAGRDPAENKASAKCGSDERGTVPFSHGNKASRSITIIPRALCSLRTCRTTNARLDTIDHFLLARSKGGTSTNPIGKILQSYRRFLVTA